MQLKPEHWLWIYRGLVLALLAGILATQYQLIERLEWIDDTAIDIKYNTDPMRH